MIFVNIYQILCGKFVKLANGVLHILNFKKFKLALFKIY